MELVMYLGMTKVEQGLSIRKETIEFSKVNFLDEKVTHIKKILFLQGVE